MADGCFCVVVLGHRCKSTEPKNLPTSDEEHVYPADTCGATNDVRLTLMQQFFKDVRDSQKIPMPIHKRLKKSQITIVDMDLS